ncbi:hypothetical protein MASR2M18_19340 [Ignavibacteria bacterium]|jgi:hypothetical protein|nr:hypothetical protein [Bacteroidota bacterium]
MSAFFSSQNIVRNITIAVFILAAVLTRLLPHPYPMPWNVSPITAIALFGAAMFPGRFSAMFIPVTAMLLSDIGLEIINGNGFHSLMLVVYGCFAAISVAGYSLRRFENKVLPSLGFAVGGSLFFFLASNFAVWIIGYPHTVEGLTTCYAAALPFFRNSLLGDLFFTGALFGSFALAERKISALASQAA